MRLSIFIFCMVFLAKCALSQEPTRSVSIKNSSTVKAQTGKVYAIVIGINHYDNIDSLRFAKNDAQAFYNLLLSPVFKVPEENVFLFLDKDATQPKIFSAFYSLVKKVSPNDLFIFYFAGHGDVESSIMQDNSLLLLSKTPNKDYLVDGDYIEMDKLNKMLDNLRIQKKVSSFLVCDACHSGSLIGGAVGQNASALSFKETLKSDVKILSCQPNELSEESPKWGNGRGVFSYYLELALKGVADDGDGIVTLEEVESFIKKEVSGSTFKKQHPYVFGNPVSEVCGVDKNIFQLAKKTYTNQKNEEGGYASVKKRGVNKAEALYNRIDRLFARKLAADILVDSAKALSKEILGNENLREHYPYLEQKLYAFLVEDFNKWAADIYDGKRDVMSLPDFGFYAKAIRNARDMFQNPFLLDDIFARYSFCEAQNSLFKKPTKQVLSACYDSLRKAQSLVPLAPFLYKQKAEVLYALGRNAEAAAQLDTLVKLLPNHPMIFNFAGMVSYKMKHYEKSLRYFQTAIKIKNDFSDAYYNTGVLLKAMGRNADANFYFQKAANKKQGVDNTEY